jgi:uracil DNA glycosylase
LGFVLFIAYNHPSPLSAVGFFEWGNPLAPLKTRISHG